MKKILVYFTTLLALILVGFVLYTNALDVGLKLEAAHPDAPYLPYIFYALCIIIIYILILNPIFTVLFAPYYSISKYCSSEENRGGNLRSRAKKIVKLNILDEQEKLNMEDLIATKDNEKLAKRLYIVYNNQVREEIDKIVTNTARDTMLVTAISQSSFIDNLTVLASNVRMIKKIVVLCGFRPTFFRICKLYLRVFLATLVSEGLNRLDVSSFISTSIKGAGKVVTNSAVSGAVNALFVLRIGMLTKNYLYANHAKKESFSIRNNAFTEAVRLFPNVLTSLISAPLKGVASMFKPRDPNLSEEENGDEDIVPNIKWRSKKKGKV